ncbi:hypothetical protein [Burkholderia lata]|uniref:DUF4145 domain-containing protein n=1 Tax=Burkholderia lata (strain ATCC 17760 / DSM 23089 / LMG 22485 / NCIMB 9086 / R18194 / 383) TaxID=482957 RepID=A0A6P2MV67_BURL3|nr:hypothetical protein [Burkholderia lata]VWB83812.1 hypothetical protein BLA6863_03981 [Burkholderia lata]
MTDGTIAAVLRDALFEHELFRAGGSGVAYAVDEIRRVPKTWAFDRDEIISELGRMSEEGLVVALGHCWHAPIAGQIVRERRWVELGRRHSSLSASDASLHDLVLAVIASGGEESDELSSGALVKDALVVYLSRHGIKDIDRVVDDLIAMELVNPDNSHEFGWFPALSLSADGARRYANDVVRQLGLRPPATILAPALPEKLPFETLGLDPVLADNLRYRWEEAGRCISARAWLASTALLGSILEVVLPVWLQRDETAARTALRTLGKERKRSQPIERWDLVDLISVAVELRYIDLGLGRHLDALRESRNLIHPDKHLRERSTPDEHLSVISREVVLSVLDAFANAVAQEDGATRRR